MTAADTTMPSASNSKYPTGTVPEEFLLREQGIEEGFIEKLRSLKVQSARLAANPDFVPLKIACVFSPPAQLAQTLEEKKDIAQLADPMEHLPPTAGAINSDDFRDYMLSFDYFQQMPFNPALFLAAPSPDRPPSSVEVSG